MRIALQSLGRAEQRRQHAVKRRIGIGLQLAMGEDVGTGILDGRDEPERCGLVHMAHLVVAQFLERFLDSAHAFTQRRVGNPTLGRHGDCRGRCRVLRVLVRWRRLGHSGQAQAAQHADAEFDKCHGIWSRLRRTIAAQSCQDVHAVL